MSKKTIFDIDSSGDERDEEAEVYTFNSMYGIGYSILNSSFVQEAYKLLKNVVSIQYQYNKLNKLLTQYLANKGDFNYFKYGKYGDFDSETEVTEITKKVKQARDLYKAIKDKITSDYRSKGGFINVEKLKCFKQLKLYINSQKIEADKKSLASVFGIKNSSVDSVFTDDLLNKDIVVDLLNIDKKYSTNIIKNYIIDSKIENKYLVNAFTVLTNFSDESTLIKEAKNLYKAINSLLV